MVYEKLVEAIVEQLEVDAHTITRETDIVTDLKADSLDLVELIMTIEDDFGISVVDESVYQHRTVGAIADFIESLL